jgi:hypothetical protein
MNNVKHDGVWRPHIGRANLQAASAHLKQIPAAQLVINSIQEQGAHQDAAITAALRNQVCVVNLTHDGLANQVTFDGEKLIPYRLLPNDGGVELRGKYVWGYQAASDEDAAAVHQAVEKRAADIAHCKKLADDLPIALANSQASLDRHVEEVDVDLSELGAMLLEQKRIQREIESQRIKLPQLEASLVPKLDQSKFVLHVSQSKMMLAFDTVYHLVRVQYHVIRPPAAVGTNVVNLTRCDPRVA